jgi:hypothetical protein
MGGLASKRRRGGRRTRRRRKRKRCRGCRQKRWLGPWHGRAGEQEEEEEDTTDLVSVAVARWGQRRRQRE